MMRSTLLHLRFPFSFFLLPVFLFALSTSEPVNWVDTLVAAFILHILLYPASNGYNSFFDKDEGSIGGLKSPPAVNNSLYYTSIALDLVAIILGTIFISFTFSMMILTYGLVSKAYSHPAIRLKKYPILGWLTIFVFQGYFIFITSYIAINELTLIQTFQWEIQLPAILSSILLGGSYPMTQIYQHEEDSKRGDLTLSRLLGILGTFHFTAVMFMVANAGFIYFFLTFSSIEALLSFITFLLPSLLYFLWWYFKVRGELKWANYSSTMKLNLISSLMLNAFFLIQIII